MLKYTAGELNFFLILMQNITKILNNRWYECMRYDHPVVGKTLVVSAPHTINVVQEKKLLKMALQARPNHAPTLKKLIYVLSLLEEKEEAIKLISHFLKTVQHTLDDRILIAKSYKLIGAFQRIISLFEPIGQCEDARVILLISESYYFQKQYQCSYRYLSKIADCNDPEVLLLKQKLNKINNNLDQCQLDSYAILENDPKNVLAKNYIFEHRFKNKDSPSVKGRHFDSSLLKVLSIESFIGSKKLSEFNNDVCMYLDAREGWIANPKRFTTTNGKQLLKLYAINQNMPEAFNVLKDVISKALAIYLLENESLDSGYFSSIGTEYLFNLWAIELHKEGFQRPHIHSDAWVSGVFYPKISSDVTENAGSIQFGISNHNNEFKVIKTVVPKEGMLLLFPSYLSHRTLPTATDSRRVSLAFDIRPYR